jgi:hypothetical protein
MIEYRHISAPPVGSKSAWYGQWRRHGSEWRTASSSYGAISYASPEAALAGAKVCAEKEET